MERSSQELGTRLKLPRPVARGPFSASSTEAQPVPLEGVINQLFVQRSACHVENAVYLLVAFVPADFHSPEERQPSP